MRLITALQVLQVVPTGAKNAGLTESLWGAALRRDGDGDGRQLGPDGAGGRAPRAVAAGRHDARRSLLSSVGVRRGVRMQIGDQRRTGERKDTCEDESKSDYCVLGVWGPGRPYTDP